MATKKHRTSWGPMYVLLLLMIIGLMFEGKDGLPDWANEVATFGIILIIFGGMLLWIRLNSSNLWQDELDDMNVEEFHIEEYTPSRILDIELQDEIHDLIEARRAR